MSMHNFYFIFW